MTTECNVCEGKGYFYMEQSIGLESDDVYSGPHIERCDTCERFKTDLLALKYVCDQAVTEGE